MKRVSFFCLIAAAAAVAACLPKIANGADAKPEAVKFDLYVMSQCPFGTKAEDAIFPAVRSLGKHVDFNLYFIANEQPTVPSEDGKPVKPVFSSLHGQPEVDENIRHLCAMKNYPKEYMDFILARNVDIRNPDWQSAAKKVGIDPAKLEACASGEEGSKLLSDSIKVSNARGANASPTIDVNGSPYTGPRGLRSVTLAVCDALSTKGLSLPDACEKAKNMPPDPPVGGPGCEDNKGQAAPKAAPPVSFNLTVLTDSTCSFCRPTLTDVIKKNHAGAVVTTLDINSEEGKTFVKKHDVQALPYYYLGAEVEQDANFPAMKGYYTKVGEGYAMRTGPDTYTPAVQLERPRVPRHLDLFVESNSQFTAQVEAQLMKFLVDSDVKELTFSIHYIVQETAKGEELTASPEKSPSTDVRAASLKDEIKSASTGPLTSRRGEAELQESMRQVCLFQHASIGTFFTYLTCRNQNILDTARGDTCLEMTEPLKQCLSGPESEKLLRQDAKLVRELGITSGPVLLWENRFGPFGWHEVDWKEMIAESKK